ncbi:ETX/MTX2 family pore-forming toxin [Pseudooceanicola sp. HF7]|uniref:ETX/MTX2 family pore-forming toxin n=1 Tax=Pseudooceanicola sp. HF7 TaxID=2721560 RepID=UPI00142F6ACC|nr:ETX/MTX2 family pore-forming toxin [Pseudooceanicola sp. HF7]NIZ08493.1 ETX/MTX2 family pore-forming toxin [Pseudooceanicola sp. HF7]
METIDPFEVVGERVRYWAEINNPKNGKGSYIASKSKMYIDSQSATFGAVVPVDVTPNNVYHTTWENNTSVQNTQTFVVEETTSDTYSWSMTAGLSVSSSFEVKVPFVGGTETTIEMNTSTTQSESSTQTRKWSYSTQVHVPPYSRLVSSFIVNEAAYDAPFTGKAVVRGKVYISFENGHVFHADIDDLITQLGWSRSTFEVYTSGVMTGLIGENFIVRTDEYDLDGTLRHTGDVIARGYHTGEAVVTAPPQALEIAEA